MQEYAVSPKPVYVAGLSVGSAAAVMGEAYSELYAAIGVKSGFAYGTAVALSRQLSFTATRTLSSARETASTSSRNQGTMRCCARGLD